MVSFQYGHQYFMCGSMLHDLPCCIIIGKYFVTSLLTVYSASNELSSIHRPASNPFGNVSVTKKRKVAPTSASAALKTQATPLTSHDDNEAVIDDPATQQTREEEQVPAETEEKVR